MRQRFHIITLGCKINQYESQAIKEAWLADGAEWTDNPRQADVVLVNSCAVTARAVRELRQILARAQRESPLARIIAAGCGAQESLRRSHEDSNVQYVPQSAKRSLLCLFSPHQREADFVISDYPRARAVLKVQDGCSQCCAYCIVPLTRGPARGRPLQEITAEALRLAQAGFAELIISGINLRQYAAGLSTKIDFWEMLAQLESRLLDSLDAPPRLRISSLDPAQLHDGALQYFSGSRLVCPHLHVSLQSASPRVLRAMGRGHYTAENVSSFLDSLRSVWPVLGFGVDILTGFPGETESEFLQTMDFCRAQPLTYGHVFPYSRRPGTRAADLPDQISAAEKKTRAAALRNAVDAKKHAFLQRCLELDSVQVALQSLDPAEGVSEHYAPCRLETVPNSVQPRQAVGARPAAVENGVLVSRPLAV